MSFAKDPVSTSTRGRVTLVVRRIKSEARKRRSQPFCNSSREFEKYETAPRFSLTVFPGRGAYLKNSVGPYLYRGPGKGFGIISLFKNTGKRPELDLGLFHAASYPIHLIIVSLAQKKGRKKMIKMGT